MTPIHLDQNESEQEITKTTEENQNEQSIFDVPESTLVDLEKQEEEEKLLLKRMNDINTFQAHENEVYLRGTDEYGNIFQICFDSYNFLEWIDSDQLKYIKEQLTKYIKEK